MKLSDSFTVCPRAETLDNDDDDHNEDDDSTKGKGSSKADTVVRCEVLDVHIF